MDGAAAQISESSDFIIRVDSDYAPGFEVTQVQWSTLAGILVFTAPVQQFVRRAKR